MQFLLFLIKRHAGSPFSQFRHKIELNFDKNVQKYILKKCHLLKFNLQTFGTL